MSTSSGSRNPVEALAEEFLERKRRGERVTPEEYAGQHPELADEILAVFPALLMMEDLGGDSGGRTGSVASGAGTAVGAASGRLGEFRLLREVGRGGMGIVYEAEQESLSRRVALKVLPAGALGDPKHVRRFEREARSAAQLHHTNIVPVFGVGQHEGSHFYVMQFIQGQGLDAVLHELRQLRHAPATKPARSGASRSPVRTARQHTAADIAISLATGRFAAGGDGGEPTSPAETLPWAEPTPDELARTLSPSDSGTSSGSGHSGISTLAETDRRFAQGVARIGVQVAEALAYAHGQGILHRDIKPSNLLLDRNGNVWVADFGLAKAVGAEDLTHTGDVVGTVRYMAPERFEGQGDARADIYSLGLTLYELLALRPAYEEKDRAGLIRQVTQEDAPRLRKLNRSIPPDLETIVHKAMARELALRYRSAAELAEDLKRFLDGRPIQARRVSPVERTWRWCKRNPVVTGLLVLLVCALVGIFGLWMRTERLLVLARRQAVGLQLEQAVTACDGGDVSRGLLAMAELLEENASGTADDQYGMRANLAAWLPRLIVPEVLATNVWMVRSIPGSAGKLLFSLDDEGRIQLWDVSTGRRTGPASERIGAPETTRIRFSGDGKVLIASDKDNNVRLWDLGAVRPMGPPIHLLGSPWELVLSDDHRQLVCSSTTRVGAGSNRGASVRVEVSRWEVATGKPVGEAWRREVAARTTPIGPALGIPLEDGLVAANVVNLAPDARHVVERRDGGMLQLWDLRTGRPVGAPLSCPKLRSLWFLPERKALLTEFGAAGSAQDMTTQKRLWDANQGMPIGPSWEGSGHLDYPILFDDGQTLAWHRDDSLVFCDPATGQSHGDAIKASVGHPDFGAINSAYQRVSRGGILTLFQFALSSGPMLSGDRKRLVTSTGSELREWDIPRRRAVGNPLSLRIGSALWFGSPDARHVVTGHFKDAAFEVWDMAKGRRVAALELSALYWGGAISAEGNSVLILSTEPGPGSAGPITADAKKTLRRWDLSGVQEDRTWVDIAGLTALLATESPQEFRYRWESKGERALQLFDNTSDAPAGPPLRLPSPATVVAVSARNDLVLTGSQDGSARLWSAVTGKQTGPVMMHRGPVSAAVFAPDARTILTASGRTARLWHVLLGRPIGPPMEHPEPIKAVQFSADGRWMLVLCDEKGAYRWPMPAPLAGEPSAVLSRVKAALSGIR